MSEGGISKGKLALRKKGYISLLAAVLGIAVVYVLYLADISFYAIGFAVLGVILLLFAGVAYLIGGFVD